MSSLAEQDKMTLEAYHGKARKSNPRPRIGTSKPKRASERTGKAPSKRLVARRKANTTAGYFPNPIGEKERAALLSEIRGALNAASGAKHDLNKQACISFAQGVVRGGVISKTLTAKEGAEWVKLIGGFVNRGLVK